MTTVRNTRRRLTGVVTANRMQRTITVRVERRFKHAKYGKFVKRDKRYHARDDEEVARVGDEVEIVSTRPLSKTVRWRLVRVLESAGEDLPEAPSAEPTGDLGGSS